MQISIKSNVSLLYIIQQIYMQTFKEALTKMGDEKEGDQADLYQFG